MLRSWPLPGLLLLKPRSVLSVRTQLEAQQDEFMSQPAGGGADEDLQAVEGMEEPVEVDVVLRIRVVLLRPHPLVTVEAVQAGLEGEGPGVLGWQRPRQRIRPVELLRGLLVHQVRRLPHPQLLPPGSSIVAAAAHNLREGLEGRVVG